MVDRIVRTIEPDKVILFGSRSKGQEDSSSDYDLLVLKRGVSNRRATAQHLYQVLADIPAPVDILVETPERFEDLQHEPGLVYARAARGLVLYER